MLTDLRVGLLAGSRFAGWLVCLSVGWLAAWLAR